MSPSLVAAIDQSFAVPQETGRPRREPGICSQPARRRGDPADRNVELCGQQVRQHRCTDGGASQKGTVRVKD